MHDFQLEHGLGLVIHLVHTFHSFFMSVYQEGAGRVGPSQLHHGGGCPGDPALL